MVYLYAYGSEKHIRMEREEAREEGYKEGFEEGYKEGGEEGFKEGLKEGLEEWWKEGQEEGIELAEWLIKEKRYEDLDRAIRDTAYRKQLFLEFGIC